MSFEPQTRIEILNRLLQNYKKMQVNPAESVEGTFSFDNLSANSVEFEKAYAEMALMMEAAFPQTSWGQYLDNLAEELGGLERRQATSAIVDLTIGGTAGTNVQAGALFATESGIQFATDELVILDETGSGTVKASAVVPGTSGNVSTGTIVKIPVSIYGITSVTNQADASDGYDEETDSELLNRLLFKLRNPVTSGNVNHYIEWATSISGVGSVYVDPLWNGAGTVKVPIVNNKNDKASDELIKTVQDYIDSVRPIGAEVTVTTPDYTEIAVKANITVADGYDADTAKEALKQALYAYFNSVGIQGTVSIAKVGKVLLDTGSVSDYDSLTLNGDNKNISMDTGHLPRLGSFEVTANG